MSMSSFVDEAFSPFALTGLKSQVPQNPQPATAAVARSAVTTVGSRESVAQLLHPDSAMFWVALGLAATFGLVAVSTSIRVGPIRVGATAGKNS